MGAKKDHIRITPPKTQKKNDQKTFFSGNTDLFFQPRLAIGPVDDVYEQEADSVADRVMRMPDNHEQAPFFSPPPLTIKPLIQEKCAGCEDEEKSDEREQDGGEEQLLQRTFADLPVDGDASADDEIVQRQSNTPDLSEAETTGDPAINWFEISRPFLSRGAESLTKSFTKPWPIGNAFGLPENAYTIQRKCDECEEEEKSVQRKAREGGSSTDTQSVEATLQSAGSPLEDGARVFMEDRFNRDFSDVRIHDDSQAHQSSSDIHALAYTNKNHIAFASGQYQPHTESGKTLLAHELTHVIQQGSAGGIVQRAPASVITAEFIPTATYSITIGGIIFTVPPEATFLPGKKMPQLIQILLKTLLQDQYDDELPEFITQIITKKGFGKHGHFASQKDAYPGEVIGSFYLEIDPFKEIVFQLDKKGLTIHLSDEDRKKLEQAEFQQKFWITFLKMSVIEGEPLPRWYGKAFFDFQTQLDPFLLENFTFFATELLQTGDPQARFHLDQAVTEAFYQIYGPLVVLELIRNDTSLADHPETQLAYVSMWKMPEKKDKKKIPTSVDSFATLTGFLKYADSQPELLRDAQNEKATEERFTLLKNFQGSGEFKPDTIKLLPPFPSFIVAIDFNPDYSTISSATNTFRMIARFDTMFGSGLHGVTVAMESTMTYSWKVFRMPASLKEIKANEKVTPAELVTATDEFVKGSPANLGEPVKTYGGDDEYEHRIDMEDVGLGDFVLMGITTTRYAKDFNWVQTPSTAGHPFSVVDAEALAKTSAYSELNSLQALKEKAASETDAEAKAELEKEIQKLETREKSGLLDVTKQDIADTKKLRDAAQRLLECLELDKSLKLSREGDRLTNPFIIRLKRCDIDLYNVFILISQMFDLRLEGDQKAVEKFIEATDKQIAQLEELEVRTTTAYGAVKTVKNEPPTFRVAAALVKEDDGNLVPLLMVAGHHPDSDPERGIYKIKLIDVTFSPPGNKIMAYVGDYVIDESVATLTPEEAVDFEFMAAERTNSKDAAMKAAIHSAMVEFGGYNNYGLGTILYRVPGTTYQGSVESETTVYEYLQMAIAALGLILLVLGVFVSAGLLTPVAAAVVTALGISVAVVGALMSIHNIQERREKGTFEFDFETAMDILNIIAPVALGVGQIAIIGIKTSRLSQLGKSLQLVRLQKALLIYDALDFSANGILISLKVKEDIDNIDKMDIPEYMKDEMRSAVAFDAVQQVAIMGMSARALGKQAMEHHVAQINVSKYKSLVERGWIKFDVEGRAVAGDNAPPFLREAQQGQLTAGRPDQAPRPRAEVEVEVVKSVRSEGDDSTISVTDKGQIVSCAETCQDLRSKHKDHLLADPELHQRLVDIENKAKEAEKSGNEKLKDEALAEAKVLEGDLASVARRESTKSFKDVKVPSKWKDMRDYKRLLAKLEANNVSPGELQDIFDNALKNGEDETFISTLYSAVLEHEKSPMKNFKTLVDGLAGRSEGRYRAARLLLERMSVYRTKQQGVQQADRILSRFSLDDLVTIAKDHPKKPGSDVDFINALDSIASKTDEPSSKIIELTNKAASPDNPDKPDLLRLDAILEGMPSGQKHAAPEIEAEIQKQNTLAKEIEDLGEGVGEGLVKKLTGGKTDASGKMLVQDAFQEDGAFSGSKAIKHFTSKGVVDGLVNNIVGTGTEVDAARWNKLEDAIRNTDLPTQTKNNIIGRHWEIMNEAAHANAKHKFVPQLSVKLPGDKKEARLDLAFVVDDPVDVAVVKGISEDGNTVTINLTFEEYKTGDAQLSTGQQKVYDEVQRALNAGEVPDLVIALPTGLAPEGKNVVVRVVGFKEVRPKKIVK